MNKPKIFIFCNGCAPEWHTVLALAEDGYFLASHVCSSHGWIAHDMGATSDWKHDAYRGHYPDGWELEWVEKAKEHAGLMAAYELKHGSGADSGDEAQEATP